ncbi:NAD-dependent epimerase/dehydratase family protein [Actinophytocola xanthii]|uniref:NAD-dependent dehydratase n=1 Tax=Actinophytocola xanthii TaxID=1912961 RepID=A0A1Q8CGE4_9PSEU|nr:NAD(P)-dependent oxidoreductase [Actinophytocola xanthii]OLF13428.1 NAD-dependent dehydratase [Actinophytocola xanthii]
MTQRILVTGAAGKIGSMLRPRLARPDRTLRLLDVAPLEPSSGEEVVTGSVSDLEVVRAACEGADAVVHLAGRSGEAPWPEILSHNIDGTFTVLEAARLAGVTRVVFASSNHAVGFRPAGEEAPDYAFPRPDTFYGVSKVTGEALGSLYHDRHGMDVVCLRIGTCTPRPPTERSLATWLSPDDCARLVEASLSAPSPGFRVVWGISANTRARFSLAEARALGYEPRDDAERYADEVSPAGELDRTYVGGSFCAVKEAR